MSQANDRDREMRPEYEIRGGVRGKYFRQYRETDSVATVTFHDSLFIITSSAGSSPYPGEVKISPFSLPPQSSPKIQGIDQEVTFSSR